MTGASVGSVLAVGVQLFDTRTPLAPLRAEIDAAIAGVVDDGRFILGPNVAAFESEFAAYCGAAHAVGVANGTDAITIALRALGIGAGDDVVVPSFTFWATAEAIVNAGARPVFSDVDPETFCVTADTVRAALTPATKAVLVVHLFGNVAPVGEVAALGLPVIEDAAQAAGSRSADGRPGALGTIATFSFFPSKNLGAFGDGGAVTTNDAELAERVRVFRFHGSYDKVSYGEIGFNSRLDEVQAAVLRVLLPHLDAWAAARVAGGRMYAEAGLGELAVLPTPVEGCEPAWHLYVIRHAEADRLAAALGEAGIGTKAYYRVPVHRQQPMVSLFGPGPELPGTDAVARDHLAIPMSAVLTEPQVAEVVAAVRTVLVSDAA
jgi:dTDP-4-amino-4,6-dideoxygalactose transaminase